MAPSLIAIILCIRVWRNSPPLTSAESPAEMDSHSKVNPLQFFYYKEEILSLPTGQKPGQNGLRQSGLRDTMMETTHTADLDRLLVSRNENGDHSILLPVVETGRGYSHTIRKIGQCAEP
jgi:hypothetical protein